MARKGEYVRKQRTIYLEERLIKAVEELAVKQRDSFSRAIEKLISLGIKAKRPVKKGETK